MAREAGKEDGRHQAYSEVLSLLGESGSRTFETPLGKIEVSNIGGDRILIDVDLLARPGETREMGNALSVSIYVTPNGPERPKTNTMIVGGDNKLELFSRVEEITFDNVMATLREQK
ncbi:MAG: hypothetical protein Q7S48_04675 [bacterium]|nr:hypothetical protein [bacterium]